LPSAFGGRYHLLNGVSLLDRKSSHDKRDTNSLGMKFVLVPRGTFWMSEDSQNAQRQVEIAHDFYLGVYPVTQEQWQAVMGINLSWFSRTGDGKDKVKNISDTDLKQFPVECVSWDDVQEFLNQLNAREKNSGWVYRLPTEAEWEYACRGGATPKQDCSFDFYFEQPTNDLSSHQANFHGNFPAGRAPKGPYLERTSKVGSYKPNRLGIYDLHGNVWEWCEDSVDGGSRRVIRGGSWSDHAGNCRAACRNSLGPESRSNDLGFRLARVPSGGQ
jgi:formylglycine-generating enzyme required for sulfatase activity